MGLDRHRASGGKRDPRCRRHSVKHVLFLNCTSIDRARPSELSREAVSGPGAIRPIRPSGSGSTQNSTVRDQTTRRWQGGNLWPTLQSGLAKPVSAEVLSEVTGQAPIGAVISFARCELRMPAEVHVAQNDAIDRNAVERKATKPAQDLLPSGNAPADEE